MSTSSETSSRNGTTSSEAKLVWRRCWESKGDMRTSRCTPRSVEPAARRRSGPVTMKVADSSPASWPGGGLVDLDVEAAPLGPPLVHAQQHLGPVLGVGARRPRRGPRPPRRGRRTRPRTATRSSSSPHADGRGRSPSRPAPWPGPRRGRRRPPPPRPARAGPAASSRSARRPSKRWTSSVTRPSSVVTARAWSASSHRSGRPASASSSARRARQLVQPQVLLGLAQAGGQVVEVGGEVPGLAGARRLRRRHGRA